MTEKIGKMVYDGSIEVKVTDGDRLAFSKIESQNGEWLNCLGTDPLSEKEPLKSIPFNPPYGEKECNCGKHVMFWLRPPKEIWPDLEMALVRVFEKK